jgi:broad specificity phosphatase PhoE
MKKIITIQHTQSAQHINGMMGSWTDWELTDLGKEHAENIGRRESGIKACSVSMSGTEKLVRLAVCLSWKSTQMANGA